MTARAPEPLVGRPPEPPGSRGRRLRLLSYNIQAGTGTGGYPEYVTRGWRHVLPGPARRRNLDRIASALADFDLVALQESDAGSLRSGYANQATYLARGSQFPFWADQVNRRVGVLTAHGNALLSRLEPVAVRDHKLPGVPGRGALEARLAGLGEALVVLVVHLALGERSRRRQLEYLREVIRDERHVVAMGDFNCGLASPELRAMLAATGLRAPYPGCGTFPSWRPRRGIDHILVGPEIRVARTFVPRWPFSDHLPVAMEIVVPAGVGV